MALNKPKWIIIHHTSGTATNPLADTSHHTLETLRHWHVKGRGWEDVGYHYVIEKDGSIRKGREENYHGAHTLGHNRDSIGVCLSGNFDATLPTKEQENSLQSLLVRLTAKYGIPINKVVPHRKFTEKSCFGKKLPDNWASKLVVNAIVGREPKTLKDYTLRELVTELISRF